AGNVQELGPSFCLWSDAGDWGSPKNDRTLRKSRFLTLQQLRLKLRMCPWLRASISRADLSPAKAAGVVNLSRCRRNFFHDGTEPSAWSCVGYHKNRTSA